MVSVCNNICTRFKSNHITTSHKYEMGQKRCSLCEVFLEYSGLRCPCCNVKLRTKSRTTEKKWSKRNG